MARNGAGTYSLPSGNPVVTNTTISSTTQNNTMTDVATALTQSLAYDGQTVPVANLPMATYRHTGVGKGVALTDYCALGQAQNAAFVWLGTGGGTADVITATSSPVTTAYAAGQPFRLVASGSNTTNVTININSLGAKAVTKNGTTALIAGDIPSGAVIEIVYDGTRFQLMSIFASVPPGPFVDTNPVVKGSSDATKLLRFEVDGNTTGTTRVVTAQNRNITAQGLEYVTAAGTDTYTATYGLAAYVNGHYAVLFTNANTSTTPTLNLDSIGAITIKKMGSVALAVGDIPANHHAILSYDGSANAFLLLNPKYTVPATQAQVEAFTDDTAPVTSLKTKFLPGAAKYVGFINGATGAITTFYTASGTPTGTRNSAGSYTIGGCALSAAGYPSVTSIDADRIATSFSPATTGFSVITRQPGGANSDASFYFFYFGDI